ncbi:16S rRNA (guanine(527)-N(7))-methyltransferase RsmG [Candidatus Saganbacteria bacterium]|uniref:Ribosomal RNA small subunit methyltransferase G n=1 Tax=Candidatus Saganbacteria bacterium TaxID=2575572 RepID=A0A9D6UMM5_UNCSA|nr:16S rRNA (guanine(527)-N(7))-methyltransferase RsmG [Candidatus Saganbacteria bacterium]
MNYSLDLYLKELLAWNKKFNLTSITDPDDIRRKHFEDSLLLLKALSLTNESVVDVGAGAGFPGIPLKIACQGIKLTLIDSVGKKVEFLKHIIRVLNLKDTEAAWTRAEDFARLRREKFDLAVSRAVAGLNVLCEYCLPMVRVGGIFAAYKEEKIELEIKEAKNALEILGGQLREVKRFPSRSLVIIDKIKETPPKYPRRTGVAKKRPL